MALLPAGIVAVCFKCCLPVWAECVRESNLAYDRLTGRVGHRVCPREAV